MRGSDLHPGTARRAGRARDPHLSGLRRALRSPAPGRFSPSPASRRDAGVTLVEILVVLAIVGVMAGALSLSIGGATRGGGPQEQAERLAARLERAGELAQLTGTPAALIWDEGGYRFLSYVDAQWQPHDAPQLARHTVLPRDMRLAEAAPERRDGRQHVLRPDGVPGVGDVPLALVLWTGDDRSQWVVEQNGARAEARPMQQVAP